MKFFYSSAKWFINRFTLYRLVLFGIIIAISSSFCILGMFFEQQKLWPSKLLFKLETSMMHKDYTITGYIDKTSVWKDLEITHQIVMLGDSIIEYGDWAEFLMRCSVSNRGIAKDTTEGLLARIDFSSGRDGMVLLMIGINDLDQSVPENEIFERYQKILSALNKRNNMVYAHSVLYSSNNLEINRKVDRLNEYIMSICLEDKKCKYIDVNRVLSDHGHLLSKYTFDGTHPNVDGYRLWANLIKDYIVK